MAQTTTPNSAGRSTLMQIVPVMLCFFAMGFVDLVGTASNYVQQDLGLTDSEANLFPSLVFFWFLIFSVPTGMLMNRIGRKNTVLISLAATAVSLVIPLFGESYGVMLVTFSMLGIGNALMQTSLNPLVSNLITPDKLASTLTLGQFVKAIASFLAPIIAAWGATTAVITFGLGWRVLFPIYAVVSILSISMLAATPIHEEKPDRASGFAECFRLLGRPFILLCFLGIMCHVGIDVGTNTIAPKILIERLSLPLEEAGFATSLYFIFRTAGCLLGAFLLRKVAPKPFFAVSVLMMVAAMAILFFADSISVIYVGIALVGLGNSNIFSVVFSQALNRSPKEQNEVSGLMIMGLFGGTVFPLAMGYASDAFGGQHGAVAVMALGVLYLLFYTLKIKKQ
ncbi:MAG: MFS transporter [Clostridium sp.]|nr:MFS transporter [Clostridium sp.]